jgi:hypothetical protein
MLLDFDIFKEFLGSIDISAKEMAQYNIELHLIGVYFELMSCFFEILLTFVVQKSGLGIILKDDHFPFLT